MPDKYYYYVDNAGNQASDPMTAEAIISLVKAKCIGRSNMAWCDGMSNWTPIEEIEELVSVIDRPNPPPPPPPPSRPCRRPSSTHRSGVDVDKMWQERLTADGVCYYYNTLSESVTWDKPYALKSDAERAEDDGEWVWLSDPVEAWIPVRVKERSGANVTVVLPDKSMTTVTQSAKEPLWNLSKSSLGSQVDDMVMVDSLNQAQMIHLLRERYNADQIYTWVGASHSVLVSINPFKQLPIYTVSTMTEFAHPSPNKLDPPHTFAIASSAYENLRSELRNQAILISGESGAGKTEATKQCFNFLAEIAGSESALEQKILNANPVLEAFGNAKTLRNNNSSRFGRWTAVHFSGRGSIIGAAIENYLLEKSRVVFQNKGERNYHVFYQLCANMASSFGLSCGPMGFRYLCSSGCITVPGINDSDDFSDLTAAFHQLEFSESDIQWVMECVAGILHLGNVTFLPDDEGSVVDPSCNTAVDAAAKYLKIETTRLINALCHRTLEIRGEVNHILHKPKEAQEAADALAKAVYNELFNWLVMRINASVKGESGHFIGVLDIFGFEIFEKNSFEQLCINFTNEKLQQHFNAHTFKEEEHVYESEGVPYEPVTFIDNQTVLDLIEKKPYGLMNLLDEEVRLPKGDELKWLAKCSTHHANHPNWLKVQSKSKTSFFVLHYAGAVGYDCTGFCDKNRDSVFRDLYDLMSSASHPNFQQLFPVKDSNPRRVDTLGGAFRKQLNNLMDVCNLTHPHYIRCIKPNDAKRPQQFNAVMCLEQLTYAGVFEAVQIRKTGYPFRLPHAEFVSRYHYLLKKKHGSITIPRGQDMETACVTILESVPQDFSGVAIGRTMVLYRAEEHRVLELLRNLYLDTIYAIAQRQVRRYISRRCIAALKRVKVICDRALKNGNDVSLFDNAIQLSNDAFAPYRAIYNFDPHYLVACRERRFALQEWTELEQEFRRLQDMDASVHFADFASAVTRSNAISHIPGQGGDSKAEKIVRDKLRKAASAKLEPWAKEALEVFDKCEMILVVQEAKAYAYSSPKIEEVERWLEISNKIDPWAERAYDARDKSEMEKVLAEAEGYSYSSPCVQEVKSWLDAVAEIERMAMEALNRLSKPDMETAVEQARDYTYNSPTITEIQTTLGLPEDKFVRKQLTRATEMGDEDRRINREIRLKDLILDMHGTMFEFGPACGVLRNGMEWASSKFFGIGTNKTELCKGMLKYTTAPIHQSLTAMHDNKEAKEAVKQFKNLMGYMGDRKYQYPAMLAVEYLNTGIEGSEAMRTEMYVQTMKQLSDNPSHESLAMGWKMLSLLLSCFPPPVAIDNYVAMFIRQQAPVESKDRFKLYLHYCSYSGHRTQRVNNEDLNHLLQEFQGKIIDEKFREHDVVVIQAGKSPSKTGRAVTDAVTSSLAPSMLSGAGSNSATGVAKPRRSVTPNVTMVSAGGNIISSGNTAKKSFEHSTSRAESEAEDVPPPPPPRPGKESSDAPPPPPPRPAKESSDVPAPPIVPRPVARSKPKVSLPPSATVMFDCAAAQEGMLNMRAGETVIIEDATKEDWWSVRNTYGQVGWAPASYLRRNDE
eukprot:CAMPEP_0185037120 /NCGR_PEP_ID=MMETSP1103-20130426/31086_1 /TAXON_ID=36769 /ORGANISM="Paraphysomonas bandaiensis, Strain Caron Lab Isolate" /LENGTH=1566 /DNA_ID=CAMNT_0027574947 /DNA_START=35 /DNA_END=4735 /DNA_ORIENTATION=+